LYGIDIGSVRVVKRLLLALLLVLAQHAAAMHALGHSIERTDDGQPVQSLHAGCLGLHGLDDAPATSLAEPEAVREFAAPPPNGLPCVRPGPLHFPYRSRAPPTSI